MKKRLSSLQHIQLPSLLRNKYFLVAAIAFIWVLFFDKYSIISQIKMRNYIARLENDKTMYKKGISDLDYKIDLMKTDLGEVEKYAREQYWLKKGGEDLFIVEEEE